MSSNEKPKNPSQTLRLDARIASAEAAIRARDELLSAVAHDLRNPLSSIFTLAAILRVNGKEREIGEEIDHAAQRMNRLIQDLLDITRLDSGRFSIRPTRLDAVQTISGLLATEGALARASAVELQADMAPNLPQIWADEDRLLQVFENLIGNAIKFTTAGGRVALKATAGEREVLFSVADTGCGIDHDQLPRVFDRFWQAPGGTSLGAGLGLSIVKGIIDGHRGRIWVESSPGKGSTFFFTIPSAA
jgi:signal transduction histidine kinase